MPGITVESRQNQVSHSSEGEYCSIRRGSRYDICGDAAVIENFKPLELPADIDYGQALRRSYLKLDSEHLADAQKYGTTGTTAIFDGKKITTATVGDSCIFIVVSDERGRPMHVERLNRITHKAIWESETDRISKEGDFVLNGRVMGELAVSRALGDRGYYKGVVTADPDIDEITIAELSDKFPGQLFTMEVIACSDGLTDKLKDDSQTPAAREKERHGKYLLTLLRNIYDKYGRKLNHAFLIPEIYQELGQPLDDDTTIFIKTVDQQPFLLGVFDGHGRGGEALRASSTVVNNIVPVFRQECDSLKLRNTDSVALHDSVVHQDGASHLDETSDIASLKEELLQLVIPLLGEYNKARGDIAKSRLIPAFLESQRASGSILNKLKQLWRDSNNFDWLPKNLNQPERLTKTEDHLCLSADYFLTYGLLISGIQQLRQSNITISSQNLESDFERFKRLQKDVNSLQITQIEAWVDEVIDSISYEEFSSRYQNSATKAKAVASVISTARPDPSQINYNVWKVGADFLRQPISIYSIEAPRKLPKVIKAKDAEQEFTEKAVGEDGNCALYCLQHIKPDANRDDIKNIVLSQRNNQAYREKLKSVLADALLSDARSILSPQLMRQWAELSANFTIEDFNKFLENEEVFTCYANYLGRDRAWLDIVTILLYADTHQLALSIWHEVPKESLQDREVKKMYTSEAASNNPKTPALNMIVYFRQGHFNVLQPTRQLSEYSAPATAQAPAESNQRQPSASASTVEVKKLETVPEITFPEASRQHITVAMNILKKNNIDEKHYPIVVKACCKNPQAVVTALNRLSYAGLLTEKTLLQVVEHEGEKAKDISAEIIRSKSSAVEITVPEECKQDVTRAINILKQNRINEKHYPIVVKACCKNPRAVVTALNRLSSSGLLTEKTLLQVTQHDGDNAINASVEIIRSQKSNLGSQKSAFFHEEINHSQQGKETKPKIPPSPPEEHKKYGA